MSRRMETGKEESSQKEETSKPCPCEACPRESGEQMVADLKDLLAEACPRESGEQGANRISITIPLKSG